MHIAVSGKIASGKDTAAAIIQNYLKDHGERSQIIKFADPLYALCARYDGASSYTADGWPIIEELSFKQKYWVSAGFFDQQIRSGILRPEEVNDSIVNDVTILAHHYKTQAKIKNRDRLKHIAEYCRSTFSPDFWVQTTKRQFQSVKATTMVIISDLRILPEACWCESAGIARLRIDVDPQIQRLRMIAKNMRWDPETINFPTETALDMYPSFTQRIENNASYEELVNKLHDFLDQH